MGIFACLNRNQKEAIGLLQIGTFLEYFDLMLYVHMAVLLNELFFPIVDPHTASLIAALAFCSTYVLRPFGALIFGYIGDTIGRKSTVILTTAMMSASCAVMANLPTYAQIGISAAWLVTGCRIIQGLSSMGEIMGAMIYATEITKPPTQYAIVTTLVAAAAFGGTVALGVASLVTHFNMNWRGAFWIGAGIAVVGSLARTRLRETPEFLEMKKRKRANGYKGNKMIGHLRGMGSTFKGDAYYKKKSSILFFLWNALRLYVSILSMFILLPCLNLLVIHLPILFFIIFLLSIVDLASVITLSYLSTIFHPLKILKFKAKIGILLILALPFCIYQSTSTWQIFLMQTLLMVAPGGSIPAHAVFIKNLL